MSISTGAEIVTGITHPYISGLYLKRRPGRNAGTDNTLVIDTVVQKNGAGNPEQHDKYIMDILLDLQSLKDQVERKVGRISHIDIRCH